MPASVREKRAGLRQTVLNFSAVVEGTGRHARMVPLGYKRKPGSGPSVTGYTDPLLIRRELSTMKVMKRKAARALSYSVFYEKTRDGGYVAFVPALPGCHTQGETLEETERHVQEAIALYVESLVAHGETIPEEGPSFQGRVVVPISA